LEQLLERAAQKTRAESAPQPERQLTRNERIARDLDALLERVRAGDEDSLNGSSHAFKRIVDLAHKPTTPPPRSPRRSQRVPAKPEVIKQRVMKNR